MNLSKSTKKMAKESPPMNEFFDYIKQGDVDQALLVFKNTHEQEQIKILSDLSSLLKKSASQDSLNIAPKMVSVVRRDLKPGKTYEDFMRAWIPSDKENSAQESRPIAYYDIPVQVVIAQNLHDPKEMISIGLVSADEREFAAKVDKYKDSDALRRQKIAEVTEDGSVHVYKVLGVYTLGS